MKRTEKFLRKLDREDKRKREIRDLCKRLSDWLQCPAADTVQRTSGHSAADTVHRTQCSGHSAPKLI